MAYLGDPREDRIDIYAGEHAGKGAGVIWESGKQKEQRFMWNGAWLDMCNLGAQEDGSVNTEEWRVLYHVVSDGTLPSGKTKVVITPSYEYKDGKLVLSAMASKALEADIELTFIVNDEEKKITISKGQTSVKSEEMEYESEPKVDANVSLDKAETENQVITVKSMNVDKKAYLKYGWAAYDDISELDGSAILSGMGISGLTCNITETPELFIPQPYAGQDEDKQHFDYVWAVAGTELSEIAENGNGYISGQAVEKRGGYVTIDGKDYTVYTMSPQDIVAEDSSEGIDFGGKFKITFIQ